MTRLLEGTVLDSDASNGEHFAVLNERVRALNVKLLAAEKEAVEARAAVSALQEVRRQLSPLYRALQMLFGELDVVAPVDDMVRQRDHAPSATIDARHAAIWETWKQRLGDGCGKVIDALLMHPMNTQQLSVATGYHRTTIPGFIHKMNKAGLLNKAGGVFSLKQMAS